MKIEIVDNPQPTPSEDEKISRYMMLARFDVGRSSKGDDKGVIIKAARATRDSQRGEEKAPPWRNDKEQSEKSNSFTDNRERERAE